MNGSAVTLDKVEIQISASAGAASENISHLSETLSELRSSIKGGFNSLSKLAESLTQLKASSKNLEEVSKNLRPIAKISSQLSSLAQITNPKGLEKTIDNLERLPSAFAKIDGKSLSNVTRVSKELSSALTPLAEKMGEISRGYSSINQLADRYGVSVTKVKEYTKQANSNTKIFSNTLSSLKESMKSIQKTNESLFKGIIRNSKNVISKVKQIGLALLGTRSIFTATRKAVSEYMAMDADLTWQITNNWRALGAQLAPIIENVIWLFKQFIRVIYSVVLALTGIDLIARANEKAMKGWGKAAKDTLGNLQKFDDLNVVEFPKSSGGDDNQLIELDTIDLSPIQKVIDWVKKLKQEIKEAWSSGQWEGVGEVLAEGLNAAIASVNFDILEEKIKNVAEKFGDFLAGVVNNFDWSTFGSQLSRQMAFLPRTIGMFLEEIPWVEIGDGLNKAIAAFDPKIIINAILSSISTFILGIQSAFLQIDASTLGEKISDAIVTSLQNIGNLLAQIEWGELGTKIRETILAIDWAEVWNSIVTIAKNAFNGIGDFVKNLLDFDDSEWDGLWAALVGIGAAFVTYKIVASFAALTGLLNAAGFAIPVVSVGLAGLLEPLAVIALAATGIYLVVQGIQDIVNGDVWSGIEKILVGIGIVLAGIALAIGNIPVLIAAGVAVILALLTKLVKTIVKHWDDIKAWFSQAAEDVADFFTGIWNGITDWLDGINTKVINVLTSVGDWVKNLFTGIKTWFKDKVINKVKELPGKLKTLVNNTINNIKSAFNSLTKFFSDFWEALKGGPKSFANFVIDKIEWLVNKIIGGVNWLIKQLNKISFDVPDWVPAIGGKTLGFNIKQMAEVKLPRLNTGTNDIPQDGPYYLHKHESVVPKKYNPAYGGGTNEDTNARLDTLIDILNNMDVTNIVNVGNETLYKQQQKFTRKQNDKYGTDINL